MYEQKSRKTENNMSATKSIDNKLLTYLNYLSERNKMLLLSMAKVLVKEEENRDEYELSEEQVKELDKRWAEYKSGKTKTYSMAQSKAAVLKKIKSIRSK